MNWSHAMLVPAALLLLVSAATLDSGVQDPVPFTSEAAKKAAAKYSDQVAKLDDDYVFKLRKVVDQYVKELDDARKAALGKKDLDEAQRVVQAQADAQAAVASRAVQRRGFEVVAARWGALTQWIDVTTQVRAKVADGRLALVPDQMGFSDPIDGTRKSLVVMYYLNGRVDLAIAGDGQPLDLPASGR